MTELDRQLIDALTGLAEQYERDQKQLSGQVEGLQERIETLTESMNSLTRLVDRHTAESARLGAG